MRAPALCCAVAAGLLLGASFVTAQESPSKPAEPGREAAIKSELEPNGPSPLWAWANFAILAGVLGYIIAKKGGPWFASRSVAIRKGIAEAEEIHSDAVARAADVDRKLAALQTDIDSLRAHAHEEESAEAGRIRQQIAADVARIQAHAAREIDSAGKSARLDLKRYAAQLAVDLAEQKIRRQMTPDMQAALVERFAADLDRSSSGPHLNK